MDGIIPLTDIDTYLEEARAAEDLLIGLKVAPPTGYPTQTGQYPKFRIASAELLKADAPEHAPGMAFPRVNRRWEFDNFNCVERGLEEVVPTPTEDYLNKFGFPLRAKAAAWSQRRQLLAHEGRVAALLFNSTNFNATGATVAYTYANLATVNFVEDVLAAKRRLVRKGINPKQCSIVLNDFIYDLVRQSTISQNYVRGNMPNDSKLLLSTITLADMLGVKEVLIGQASYDSSGSNQPFATSNLQSIWGYTYIFIGILSGGDIYNGGAARTIFWEERGGLFQAVGYPEWHRDSNIVRCQSYCTEKMIDTTCGELITTSATGS